MAFFVFLEFAVGPQSIFITHTTDGTALMHVEIHYFFTAIGDRASTGNFRSASTSVNVSFSSNLLSKTKIASLTYSVRDTKCVAVISELKSLFCCLCLIHAKLLKFRRGFILENNANQIVLLWAVPINDELSNSIWVDQSCNQTQSKVRIDAENFCYLFHVPTCEDFVLRLWEIRVRARSSFGCQIPTMLAL